MLMWWFVGMPSLKVHNVNGCRFLVGLGVSPDEFKVVFVNKLIDMPSRYADVFKKLYRSALEERVECAYELLRYGLIIEFFEEITHDLETQKYSPKRLDKSKWMIKFLRDAVDCLVGSSYGLLVDLHVLLDMADKTCCDTESLTKWCEQTNINQKVYEYYIKHQDLINKQLKCSERLKSGKCRLREVIKFILTNNSGIKLSNE